MNQDPKSLFHVKEGFATFGPEIVRIMQLLDDCFLAWARTMRAQPMLYPSLISTRDLAAIDYFENFPHLGMFVSKLNPSAITAGYGKAEKVDEVANEHLCCAEHALPSAACYNVYASLKEKVLEDSHRVTTVANCHRNETHYDGLKRLRSFRMREVVVVGEATLVHEHLRASKQFLTTFSSLLGIPLQIVAASDPFFDQDGHRAKMQRLFPVKEEFVFGETVAIASLNYHRNFFGEKFQIKTSSGEVAHSGCVGMGLERWIHALLECYKEDTEAIGTMLSRQLATLC